MSTLNLCVIRNRLTGKYILNDVLEEGDFSEAMAVAEKNVHDVIDFLQEVWESQRDYADRYIGRRPPKPIDLEYVLFALPEPHETAGEDADA